MGYILGKLKKIVSLVEDPRAMLALVTWPKFSMTSYFMMSNLAKQGITPNTVLDVGANVGQFSVAASKFFPKAKIHSFEPQPECVGRLSRNVKKLDNIKVYPLALGEYEGEIKFYVNSHNHSSSILPLAESHRVAFPEAQESEEITVDLSMLDKVLSGVDIVSPCLLKLDVQGYEVHALRGGMDTLRKVDFVILESSFKPMYKGESLFMDVVKVMQEFGFQFLRPVGWLTDPNTDEVLQMDALFVRADTVKVAS